jgi:hypothetical protein
MVNKQMPVIIGATKQIGSPAASVFYWQTLVTAVTETTLDQNISSPWLLRMPPFIDT